MDNLVEIINVENADKLKEYGTYKIIKIAWKDMSDVNLPIEFWEELVNVIRTTNRKTIISCVGGHGRTGTALSILTYLMLENKNPIEFVRKNYCDEAVETMDQIVYIEKICNLKLEMYHLNIITLHVILDMEPVYMKNTQRKEVMHPSRKKKKKRKGWKW